VYGPPPATSLQHGFCVPQTLLGGLAALGSVVRRQDVGTSEEYAQAKLPGV